ncbi:MAG: hypothetical protein U1D55_17810 [Phycisphaerae bacterium]
MASAAVGLFLPACDNAGREGVAASPRQHPTLEGVPLPNGFRLVDDRSVGRATGPTRIGKFEFVGDAERSAVMRFYKEYMPSGGWKLLAEDFDRGVYDLHFESQTEECNVRIRPETARRSTIVINIGPRPQGAIERGGAPPAPASHDGMIPIRRVREGQ